MMTKAEQNQMYAKMIGIVREHGPMILTSFEYYLGLYRKYGATLLRALDHYNSIERSGRDMGQIQKIVAELKNLQAVGYVYDPLAAQVTAHNFLTDYPNVNIPRVIRYILALTSDWKAKGELNVDMWHLFIRKNLKDVQSKNAQPLDIKRGPADYTKTEHDDTIRDAVMGNVKEMLRIK
jgi:hypothetical protein